MPKRNNKNSLLITIAVKQDTYKALLEIKSKYKFRSFDDVVKMLIDAARDRL